MANVNPEIWGAVNSWVYSELAYGIEGAGARFAGYAKPMTANFGDGQTQGYRGSLLRAINVTHKMTLNEKLDRSICPCGQAPDVSPWGKIAIFNENSDLSTTPSRVITDTNNINWFLCDRNANGNNARYFSKVYNNGNNGGLAFQQFAPLAYSPASSVNTCMRLTPYVYYGLRSFVATIQVHLLPKNGTYDDITVNSKWVNLDSWVNYKDTHDLIGLRLFFRNCTALNANTLVLTYNNDTTQYGGQYSNQIAVIQDITVNNNGNNVETEFLSLNMQSGVSYRSGYIFDVCNVQNYPSSDNRRTNGVLPCWEYFDGQQIKRWKSSDNYDGAFWYTIPYSQTNYDKIMKIAALFGCFFTPTAKYTFNYDMLDNDLYLPILDANGVAHGQYTRGADNANNSLYTVSSIRDIDYNPDTPPKPVDTNTYSVTTGFNTVGNVATTTKAYVINSAGIQGLSKELWTIIDNLIVNPTDIENLYNMTLDTFLTNNPIDAIVSVKKFPLSSVPHGENLENVYLGKVQTGAAAYPLAMQQARYNFTSIPIFPKFGNCFLDYAPYTKMQLYVPFCGTIDIDAADFMGRSLSVEMVIDFITGTVTAYVLANELVVTSLTGTCAIDIPITGTEQATVNSAYESAAISERQSRGNWIMERVGLVTHPVKTLTKPLTSVAKDVSTQLSQAQSTYELTHINIPLRQIGNASPLNSWALEFVCRLIIYYPDGECISFNATNEPSLITDKVESFGAVNGFATVETDTLSSFTGFTQVSDVDLTGISATDTEKEMILSLLQSGVYI